MNRYYCSDGSRVTESQIKNRLKKLGTAYGVCMCACCGKNISQDNDHTIAKARCKQLRKTELIWDVNNIETSCRSCHEQWESYKSGEFVRHANFEKRMDYMKIHDPEGWQKRMNAINEKQL